MVCKKITGTDASKGGIAIDTGKLLDGKIVYKRESGGHYTVEPKTNTQKKVDNPNPSSSTLSRYLEHHNKQLDLEMENRKEVNGSKIVKSGRVYHTDNCEGGFCIPDALEVKPDGTRKFIEIKTGGAGFTPDQKIGYQEKIDANGKKTYWISPDSTVGGGYAKALELKKGQKIGDLYPDGIEVELVIKPGLKIE